MALFNSTAPHGLLLTCISFLQIAFVVDYEQDSVGVGKWSEQTFKAGRFVNIYISFLTNRLIYNITRRQFLCSSHSLSILPTPLTQVTQPSLSKKREGARKRVCYLHVNERSRSRSQYSCTRHMLCLQDRGWGGKRRPWRARRADETAMIDTVKGPEVLRDAFLM